MSRVFILSAQRTPIGAFQGVLAGVPTPTLGKIAVKGALESSNIPSSSLEEVFMGCVLSAGLGQAPARQAALGAGVPVSVPCATVNKVCGSGMKAIMLAADAIEKGAHITVGGGMENMSRAPYLLPQGRSGYRLGHGTLVDHVFCDGLEDAYEPGTLMGVFADRTAESYKISREEQDAFAARSVTLAREAIEAGYFKTQIIPVTTSVGKEEQVIHQDEPPYKAMPEKLPRLKAIFTPQGTVTAGSSSSNADGAAVLVLGSDQAAQKSATPPLGMIVGAAQHSQEPQWFTTAPVGAIQKLLSQMGWSLSDVDLFEINEAFAVVTLAAIKELKIPLEKVNVHGGACALGHPIGASGARVVVTLLGALHQRNLRRGIAAVCIGGGEAVALAIERLT